MAVGIRSLQRHQLISALEAVQHFCPPRPTRQDKETLVKAVWQALNSDRYCVQMAHALRDNGMGNAALSYIPPRDQHGAFIRR